MRGSYAIAPPSFKVFPPAREREREREERSADVITSERGDVTGIMQPSLFLHNEEGSSTFGEGI